MAVTERWLLFSFFLGLSFFATITHSIGPVVVTPLGVINGGICDESAGYKFLNIPYAEPPVGTRRFKRSVPWDKPFPEEGLNATTYGTRCAQYYNGAYYTDEDCLQLNVFTPPYFDPNNATLPVRVWIHGGAFYRSGAASSTWFDGCMVSALEPVVDVTMNFRLNVFGFIALPELAEEDEEGSTGNLGMQDIRLSLRWVKNYIRYFGGDPTKVVLGGGSSGGTAVLYHLVAPESNGLFSAAFSTSGGGDMFFKSKKAAIFMGEHILRNISCDVADLAAQNFSSRLECLRSKPTLDLILAIPYTDDAEDQMLPVRFKPVVDGVDLPDKPITLIAQGKWNKVPAMFGASQNDGTDLRDSIGDVSGNRSVFDYYVERVFQAYSDVIKKAFDPAKYAPLLPSPTLAVPFALDKLITSWLYRCPIQRIGRLMARQGEALYAYDWRVVMDDDPYFETMGVYHGSDLCFLHRWINTSICDGGPQDRDIAQMASETITNMAREGHPLNSSSWEVYDPTKKEVYVIEKSPFMGMEELDLEDVCIPLEIFDNLYWTVNGPITDLTVQNLTWNEPIYARGDFSDILVAGDSFGSAAPLSPAPNLLLSLIITCALSLLMAPSWTGQSSPRVQPSALRQSVGALQ